MCKEVSDMTVGDRIKLRRNELGLSQSELALKMGYSDKTGVSKAETCGDNITTTKIARFAEALDCSFNFLMGWEDNLNEETGAKLADYLEDVELFSYIERIKQASPETRNKILSMIDIMLRE